MTDDDQRFYPHQAGKASVLVRLLPAPVDVMLLAPDLETQRRLEPLVRRVIEAVRSPRIKRRLPRSEESQLPLFGGGFEL